MTDHARDAAERIKDRCRPIERHSELAPIITAAIVAATAEVRAELERVKAERELIEAEVAEIKLVIERLRLVCIIKTKPHMSYSADRYERLMDEFLAGKSGQKFLDRLHELSAKVTPELNYWVYRAEAAEAERERLAGACGLSTEMTALAYRMVVANHMRTHAGINKPEFEDCRQGFCGDWHALQAKATDAARAALQPNAEGRVSE